MDKRLYAAYRTDTHNNPFGRDCVGYAGWHTSGTEALAEAARRNPDIRVEHLQVSAV